MQANCALYKSQLHIIIIVIMVHLIVWLLDEQKIACKAINNLVKPSMQIHKFLEWETLAPFISFHAWI